MSFFGVKALDDVSISLEKSQIMGLVGENGAGKSTLIKILSGVYRQTEGDIFIEGTRMRIESPASAIRNGVITVHQEITIEPHLSVAENIFLGRQIVHKTGLIDYKKMNAEAVYWLKQLDIDISPEKIVRDISVAEQQMVVIAKAISLNARVIIFDEPTASLSKKETDSLFTILRKIKEKGISVIYISHRLEEIKTICDIVWVLRDGKCIGSRDVHTVDLGEIIQMMIGRNIEKIIHREEKTFDDVILEVTNISSLNGAFRNISFKLHRGEIVTLTGLMGSGCTEIGRALFGDNKYEGEIKLDAKVFHPKRPMDSMRAKIGYISEERKELGLILPHSVYSNISMAVLKELADFGFFTNIKNEQALGSEYIAKFSIKTPSLNQPVKYLSGGNQQKVVIAKWLAIKPDILIVDEPTRGVDVGAKMGIYQLLHELTKEGVSILMISTDLPEVLLLSDRILILQEGAINGSIAARDASEEIIMNYATGQIKGDTV
ncbi:MAG: sugar ABC transporter ATP-binding protein [Treponema sp.]|jgi:ribose transport system ATP-binding protein|nr:sugar ABC transporter ATP-binding protein [Treponema sp.]